MSKQGGQGGQESQYPLDTTKEIRKTKQDRANAKRKFTRKVVGFRDMMITKVQLLR